MGQMKSENRKPNLFVRIRGVAIDRMAPDRPFARDHLAFWRIKILATILLSSAICFTLALALGICLSVSQSLWALLIVDILGYSISIGLLFLPGIQYEIRAGITLLTLYCVGMAILIFIGPVSGGPIYLFAFPVITGVLLSFRAAVFAVGMNALSLSVVSWLIRNAYLGQPANVFDSPISLVTALVSYFVLNIVTAFSVAVLVEGLTTTLQKEKVLTSRLGREREELVTAKKMLEIEIEDRKQAEASVRASEAKYRLLADNASDVIWVMDISKRRLTYVSPSVERARGFTVEEVIAQPMNQFLAPASCRRIEKMLDSLTGREHLIQPDRPVTMEIEQSKKDGGTVWSEITFSFICGGDGMPISTLGVSRDITERKRAEQERADLESQLRQSKKMEAIGTLAGGIAHDFNNILSAIIGFSELCIDDVPPGSMLNENLNEIFRAGKRAKELVKQILTFARQSDDKMQPVMVSAILKETLKFIRSSIPTTIQIESAIESNALVLSNPTQLHQVLINLFTNAAHAMEEKGGVLTVRLAETSMDDPWDMPIAGMKTGRYLQLTVADTGVGIEPKFLASIFDPYFTTKDIGKGTGMGLAMVHGIVESCGGKIGVDSTVGKGTVFTVYLPVTSKSGEARTNDIDPLDHGKERILFVDDEVAVARVGGQVLERLGYAVTTRTDSVDALNLFQRQAGAFDLVITDMTIPNMAGDEFAEALMDIRPDIPIIICTGYSNRISEKEAARIGVKGFAYKPIVRSDLAKLVRKVLDGRGHHAAAVPMLSAADWNNSVWPHNN